MTSCIQNPFLVQFHSEDNHARHRRRVERSLVARAPKSARAIGEVRGFENKARLTRLGVRCGLVLEFAEEISLW